MGGLDSRGAKVQKVAFHRLPHRAVAYPHVATTTHLPSCTRQPQPSTSTRCKISHTHSRWQTQRAHTQCLHMRSGNEAVAALSPQGTHQVPSCGSVRLIGKKTQWPRRPGHREKRPSPRVLHEQPTLPTSAVPAGLRKLTTMRSWCRRSRRSRRSGLPAARTARSRPTPLVARVTRTALERRGRPLATGQDLGVWRV